MTDQGNTHAAIARRIREPRANVKWWAVKHSGCLWMVTSRIAGQVPQESRDGHTFALVVGPFNSRRQAHGARLTMQGEA